MSDVLDFKRYATHMQQVCNTNINDMYRTFSEKSGNVLSLRVPTSGATVSEYFEMMLASIEKYLLSDIARQRDMSKTFCVCEWQRLHHQKQLRDTSLLIVYMVNSMEVLAKVWYNWWCLRRAKI